MIYKLISKYAFILTVLESKCVIYVTTDSPSFSAHVFQTQKNKP